ncbi:MAG: M23 family metallopeptidase [Gammaproteobacteria bacterium]|nr:MAG: M23 family metallopeptidase [Gammaproteobacteria bacterium]
MNSVALLATLMAVQGQALQLGQPHEAGLTSIDVTWNERRIPYVRVADRWMTVIGIDLDTDEGNYPIEVSLRYADGRVATRTDLVRVQSQRFPTTELTVAPQYVNLSPEDQERAARESRQINAIYSTLTPEAYWLQPFQVPIPGTTGGRNFGHRRVFNGESRAPHSGADLSAVTGTEILAVNAGRIVLAKNLFFSGNAVFIDHGLGVYSTYLHLSEMFVEPGTMVEQGQVIGLAGATGRVTGPHLHWGVRVLSARVDPFSLLSLGGDSTP